MRTYDLYQVIDTEDIYRYDNAAAELVQLGGRELPYIRYKEKMKINWQLLNSANVSDVYTGFAGSTISASAAMDNDWSHYLTGTLASSASGAVTSITISGLTEEPYSGGTIILINSAEETESVNYTTVAASGSDYIFTVSATLSYSYNSGDEARVKDTPIIKVNNTEIDQTDKDTGLFVISASGDTQPFQDKIQGSASISSCVFELKIYDASADCIFVGQCDWLAMNIVDDDGSIPPPAVSSGYYTATQVDALLADKVDLTISAQQSLTDNTTTSIVLGATSAYRGYKIAYTIDDGTDYQTGELSVLNNNSTIETTRLWYAGDDFDTVGYAAVVNGTNIDLQIIVTSHGSNPQFVYSIIRQFAVST